MDEASENRSRKSILSSAKMGETSEQLGPEDQPPSSSIKMDDPTEQPEPEIPPYERTIRAFPGKPVPPPNSLTDFVEKAKVNSFLIEAVKKLYEVPNKPENPIEWFRLYFNSLQAERKQAKFAKDRNRTEEVTGDDDMEQQLKEELASLHSRLLSAYEAEAQNKAIIAKLECELKNAEAENGGIATSVTSGKNPFLHDDFRSYRRHPDNYHYRIKPDPSYQPSRSDMLLSDEESANGGGDQKTTMKPSGDIMELFPTNPCMLLLDTYSEGMFLSNAGSDGDYKDYPELYFPAHKDLLSPRVPPLDAEDESIGLETSEAREMEYDGSSEGEEESLQMTDGAEMTYAPSEGTGAVPSEATEGEAEVENTPDYIGIINE